MDDVSMACGHDSTQSGQLGLARANGEIVLAAAVCTRAVTSGVLPTANIVCASDVADAASSH